MTTTEIDNFLTNLKSGNIPVRWGLVQQGHIPVIEQMLSDGATWEDIGRAINWDAATLKQHYYFSKRRMKTQ